MSNAYSLKTKLRNAPFICLIRLTRTYVLRHEIPDAGIPADTEASTGLGRCPFGLLSSA